MKCKGFLFDLDGTLIDSLGTVERCWADWARLNHLPVNDVLNFIHGKQAMMSVRHFLAGQPEEIIQREFDYIDRMESEQVDGIVALPGAVALLRRLDALSVPWAIVTSGTVPVARARYAVSGLPEPKIFITAEQVSRGKPAPDPYLLGAQQLGLSPADCVVVEDAAAGVASGLAAGCQVLAVNVPADTPQLQHVAKMLTSLEQLIIEPATEGVDIHFTSINK